jgi:hypothetical protein
MSHRPGPKVMEIEEKAKGVGAEQRPVHVERRMLAPSAPPESRSGPVGPRGSELPPVDADE